VSSDNHLRRRNFALERSESPLGGVIADNRFRVTDQNTAKLWENFESHIRKSVSGSLTNITNNSATGQPSPPNYLKDKYLEENRTSEIGGEAVHSPTSAMLNIYGHNPNYSGLRNKSPAESNVLRESQMTGEPSIISNRLIDMPLQTDQEQVAKAQNFNQSSATR
jgi:hypothetical protein